MKIFHEPASSDAGPLRPARWLTGRRRALAAAGAAAAAVALGGPSAASAASTMYAVGGTSTSGYIAPIDLGTRTQGTPLGITGSLNDLVLSPDHRTVYAVSGTSATGKVTPVDVATNALGADITGAALTNARNAAISPDGRTLYVITTTTVVPVDLSAATPALGTPIPIPGASSLNSSEGGVAITPDGETLIAARRNALAHVDLATGTATEISASQGSSDMEVSGDGETVYVAGTNVSHVLVYDVATRTVTGRLDTPNSARAVELSRDGSRLYVSVRGGTLSTFDLATGERSDVDISSTNQPTGLALTPNGREAWIPATTGNVVMVDLVTEQVSSVLLPTAARNLAVAISPPDPDGAATPTIAADVPDQSGTPGDPTNPGIAIEVRQTDEYGDPVPASDLVVTAGSDDEASVPTSGVTVVGTGARRTVNFAPAAWGAARITLTVTGAGGKTASTVVQYVVTHATTPTSRYLQGVSDPSTALDAGEGFMIVAEDESNELFLYREDVTGSAIRTFDVGSSPNSDQNAGGEIDYESSARKGDTAYWFGSHGNNKTGGAELSRHTVIATRISGFGEQVEVRRTGAYGGIRRDLVAWDIANGDPLGLDQAQNGRPDRLGGLNLEGVEFSPDDRALYLGFRSPVLPHEIGGKALIVPLLNLEGVTSGRDAVARFGEPILLDLDGLSIRELRKNAAGQYLILGGFYPGGGTPEQALFSWTGERDDAPVRLTTPVPNSEEQFADAPAAWEGFGAMPETLVPGAQVRLIMDQGFVEFQGGVKNKQEPNPRWRKSRTDLFTLDGTVGAQVAAAAPVFAPQATGTTSPGQWVTLTNTGAQKLVVDGVRVRAADDASAGEFLIGQDDCADLVLGVGESCRVQLRFAPSRQSATSTASLVVKGNVAGGEATVALSGTSTTLPSGADGQDGQDGQNGGQGPRGDQGGQGPSGQDGAAGPKGDQGAQGPGGPAGGVGPSGPVGPQGQAGRDGTFAISARAARASVRRGRVARATLTLRNGTTQALPASTATVRAPRALRAGRTAAVRVAALDAGRSRSVALQVRVGREAKVGAHRVELRLQFGGRTVTRTVVVRVRR